MVTVNFNRTQTITLVLLETNLEKLLEMKVMGMLERNKKKMLWVKVMLTVHVRRILG